MVTVNVSKRRASWKKSFQGAGGRKGGSVARNEYAFGRAMKAQNEGRLDGMRRPSSKPKKSSSMGKRR